MNLHRTSILWAASLLSPILLLATPAHADIPNEPPSVSITSPTDGQMFDGPTATIDVVVQASPGDDGIESVSLLVDDAPALVDSDMPYGFEGIELDEGMHTLTAVVVSAATGDEFPSEAVEIVVLGASDESGSESTEETAGGSGGTSGGETTAGTPPPAKGCSLSQGTQFGAGLILVALFGLLTLAPRRREG